MRTEAKSLKFGAHKKIKETSALWGLKLREFQEQSLHKSLNVRLPTNSSASTVENASLI